MVIRRVELAAFIQVAVTYVIIEDLAAVLSEAADPVPGYAPIGAKEVVVFTPTTEQSRWELDLLCELRDARACRSPMTPSPRSSGALGSRPPMSRASSKRPPQSSTEVERLPMPWQDTLSLIIAADAGAVPADPAATAPSDVPRSLYRTRWRFR
jgi:hypothetical protein